MSYSRRDKIVYIPEQQIYKFGYHSKHEGLCIIFWEDDEIRLDGSRNDNRQIRDCKAVKLLDIRPVGVA